MSVSTDDPAVHRRRLRVELRALRKDSGRTQRDVAEAMDWSPSKLIRIESGDVRITPVDVRALLREYGVHDPSRVDLLVDMARSSRQDSWSDFKDVHSTPWLRFLAYESSASLIRDYEALRLPGLLQTEEYALAVYKASEVDTEVAEKRWEAHLRRQALHELTTPPTMLFILDEAVLRRQVGGPRVMRRQIERLKELSALPHITLRVIPFSVGGYFRLGGSFVLLEFPDANDDDVLHIEDPQGGVTLRDEVAATSAAVEDFVRLEDSKIALPVDETTRLLEQLILDGAPADGGAGAPKEKK